LGNAAPGKEGEGDFDLSLGWEWCGEEERLGASDVDAGGGGWFDSVGIGSGRDWLEGETTIIGVGKGACTLSFGVV
jgi:hypothetical protein